MNVLKKVDLKGFLKDYETLKETGYEYMVVYVSVEGGKPEMIVNPKHNVDAKMIYYRTAYDNDLRLKANPKIQIVDYHFTGGKGSIDDYYRLGAVGS